MTSRDAPLYRSMPVRIGCVQYNPQVSSMSSALTACTTDHRRNTATSHKFKDVAANTAKVRELTSR
jgi:hypothetical protein